jgi:hypothetical protein
MNGNFHVRFLEEEERATVSSLFGGIVELIDLTRNK